MLKGKIKKKKKISYIELTRKLCDFEYKIRIISWKETHEKKFKDQ